MAAVEVTVPEFAAVPVLDAPEDTTSGPVADMPANSWTSKLTKAAAALWTVTVTVGDALAAYHISPFELWEAVLYEPINFQVLPAVSVTEVMWLVAPLYSLAESTSRSPPPVATGKEPDREVAEAVSVPLALWTRWGRAAVEVMVRLKVVSWEGVPDPPPVPVTVMVKVPVVDGDVVTCMIELPPEVTDGGVKDTRAPVGSPVADRATVWGPLTAVVVMLVVAVLPADTDADGGDAAMVKSGGGGAALTVSVKLWLAGVPNPLSAVIARGRTRPRRPPEYRPAWRSRHRCR